MGKVFLGPRASSDNVITQVGDYKNWLQSLADFLCRGGGLAAELMWKHSGWCLLRPMKSDQSEQIGLFEKGVLKGSQ